MAIGFDETERQFEFQAETLLLKMAEAIEPRQNSYVSSVSRQARSRYWLVFGNEATASLSTR